MQLSFFSAAGKGEVKVRKITHLSENSWKCRDFPSLYTSQRTVYAVLCEIAYCTIYWGSVECFIAPDPCFQLCNVIFSCQPFALTAWCGSHSSSGSWRKQEWYLAEKSYFGCCWAQELQIVPGSCRFDTLGCSVTRLLVFHALTGFFQVLSSPLCSLVVWILCMIFTAMKNSSFFLCQWLIFSCVLWFWVLTWLARRENNGEAVLKNTVMLFSSYGFWINPWITVLELLQILQSLLTGKPGESISSAQWMGHIPQIIQSIKNWFLF